MICMHKFEITNVQIKLVKQLTCANLVVRAKRDALISSFSSSSCCILSGSLLLGSVVTGNSVEDEDAPISVKSAVNENK